MVRELFTKVYTRINWKNRSEAMTTALGATLLNRMDYTLDETDSRIVTLDTVKAEESEVLQMVKEWSMDEKTGIITVTKKNGEKIMFDLNIEKIPVSFTLSTKGILTMTTDDGTKFTADIGSMIPVLTFKASDTINVSVEGSGANKTYSFSVKEGSIKDKHLQPSYLADITVQAQAAANSSTEAQTQADRAKTEADRAKQEADKAAEVAGSAAGVSGVKGNAETTYRHGNVNITPENLGIVDKVTYLTWLSSNGKFKNGDSVNNIRAAVSNGITYFGINPNLMVDPAPPGNPYGFIIIFKGSEYSSCFYLSVLGELAFYSTNNAKWVNNIASATKATQDGNGNVIANTYAKNNVYAEGTFGNSYATAKQIDINVEQGVYLFVAKASYTIKSFVVVTYDKTTTLETPGSGTTDGVYFRSMTKGVASIVTKIGQPEGSYVVYRFI